MSFLPDFKLETYFSKWEFNTKFNLCASDTESLDLKYLLSICSKDEKKLWDDMRLGYTETFGSDILIDSISKTYDKVDKKDILTFAGAEEWIYISMNSILSSDDHCIVITPNYQSAQTIPSSICDVTNMDLDSKNNWNMDLGILRDSIKPNTKLVFGEVIGNPGLDVMNVPEVAKICKKKNVPLAIDATFNTPYLMKPISYGANIVIHSLTKWIGGHGIAIGGAIINGGNFDWGNKEKFPTISGPHFALNGISFWEEFGPSALTAKIRAEGMYNFEPSLSPNNAFYILQGIETLSLRMNKHIENTKMMLEFLKENEAVSWLRHPDLEDHPDHKIAKKILPLGSGSIIVFGIKGGRDAGKAFIENVKLSSHLANVGDAKTLLIHPGSTTHSHLSSEAMKMSGLTDDMIRLSVGLEDIEDIKIDFEKGFKAAAKISSKRS